MIYMCVSVGTSLGFKKRRVGFKTIKVMMDIWSIYPVSKTKQ